MTIGGFLCYPQLDAIIQDVSAVTRYSGSCDQRCMDHWESTRVFSYTESVIPILLAVFVLMYLNGPEARRSFPDPSDHSCAGNFHDPYGALDTVPVRPGRHMGGQRNPDRILCPDAV